jgi:isoleucyl-tRNA synthetase
VDELGCYHASAGQDLAGKFVLEEGTEKVLQMIRDDVVHLQDHVHSYPYDWRTKKPVIIRASQQWFLDTNAIKSRAVDLLENVRIIPKVNSEMYKRNLKSQIQKRPYWCISRQRKWGVPIPVFFDRVNEKILISE